MKIIALDVETTGLYDDTNDIIQLACILTKDGKPTSHTFNQHCQPVSFKNISQEALDVTGMTIQKLHGFQKSDKMLDSFIAYLRQVPGKYIMCGHNVGFDKRFIFAWFQKHDRTAEFHELFEIFTHDTLARARQVKKQKQFETKQKLNLGALCELFGIELDNAHDAFADIKATIEVDSHLSSMLGDTIQTKQIDHVISIPTNLIEPAHLHIHSGYNLAESLNSYSEWITWAEENNVPGIGIVDHGPATSLYPATADNDTTVSRVPGVCTNFKTKNGTLETNIWATSNDGYSRLMQYSTIGYDDAVSSKDTKMVVQMESSVIDKVGLDGLMFGTGDMYNSIGNAIKDNNHVLAEALFEEYISLFGDKLLVELIPTDVLYAYSKSSGLSAIKTNEMVPDGNLGQAYNQFMHKMATKKNCKIIVSDAAHFINPNDKSAADILSLATYKSTGFCAYESHHAKLAPEAYSILKRHIDTLSAAEFNQWAQTSIDLSASVDVQACSEYALPKIEIPQHIIDKTDDYNKQLLLYTLDRCKFHGRVIETQEYKDRLKKEIDVIAFNKELSFLPYFLMYEDIGCYARGKGILQNIGRGSAAGSLLSFYLKIVHIDPVKNNIPFERFLSHARIAAKSWPDIDSDFGSRVEILNYLKRKYNHGFVHIGTLLTMKTKSALKLAMASLHSKGANDPVVRDVCNLIPDSPQGVAELDFINGFVDKEGTHHMGIMETEPEVGEFFKVYPEIYRLVCMVVGTPRSWGKHPSGFVVSSLDIYKERMPLWKSADATDHVFVSQFEAPMVENMGLIKADILGVKTISTVSKTMELIKQRHGIDLLKETNGLAKIYDLPHCEGTYDDFYNADTDSVFQFNTEVVKSFIKEFAPRSTEDLAIITALLRPGALDAVMYDTSATQYYLDVKNNKREVEYIHPDMEKYVGSTNGIFCIAKGQKVATINGELPIEEITCGMQVLTEDGTYQKVVKTTQMGDKETVRVRGSEGEELVCTADHKVLTDSGWIEAGKLTKQNLIKSFWVTEKVQNYGTEEDWFIGLLIADGDMCGTSYNVACANEKQAKFVADYANSVFDVDAHVKFYGRCWYAMLPQRRNGSLKLKPNHRTENKIVQLCKKLGLHGKRCKEKELPNDFSLMMLAGIFDGDGSTKTKVIRLANERLAKQIYLALDSLRISASYYKCATQEDVYVVSIGELCKLPLKLKSKACSNKSLSRTRAVPRRLIHEYIGSRKALGGLKQHFCKSKIDFPISRKHCEAIINRELGEDVKWSRVLSVKKDKSRETYDLSVDTNHSFVVGGLVVHNCFQEQILKFLVDFAGYTLEESDMVRSAIAKKKTAVMMEAFDKIRTAADKKGWKPEEAEAICQQVLAFSRYSFNYAHSKSYSYLGYICAYLKHNFPLEWWASESNVRSEGGGFEDNMRNYIGVVGDMFVSPNLANPTAGFTIDGDHIQAPLSAIKGVGSKSVSVISEKGPFSSLNSLLEQVPGRNLGVGLFYKLVAAGATEVWQDKSLPLVEQQEKIFEEYKAFRKIKPKKEYLFRMHPIEKFQHERGLNYCFNKPLLEFPGVEKFLFNKMPKLKRTNRSDIPYIRGEALMLRDVRCAEKLVNKEYDKEVCMVAFTRGSFIHSGLSKKSGKPYSFLKVYCDDGIQSLEVTQWDVKVNPKWLAGSFVYLRGVLSPGYREKVSLTVKEIEKLS